MLDNKLRMMDGTDPYHPVETAANQVAGLVAHFYQRVDARNPLEGADGAVAAAQNRDQT